MSSAVIVMRSDFVDGAHYAPALTDELIRFYDSRRDASNAQGLRADWQPPRDDGGHSVLRFLSVADSLMQHHPDIFPAMVFALQPAQVRDDAALARWLGEWLHVIETSPRLGARVRFVLPRIDAEPFEPLQQQHSRTVHIVKGRYTMASVPRELLAESGERGPNGGARERDDRSGGADDGLGI
ncbi:hypothetical protein QLQ97_09710 [Burkholderia pseudomallei]|nr:hypothetical protein [Burkholderia pseudomallei]